MKQLEGKLYVGNGIFIQSSSSVWHNFIKINYSKDRLDFKGGILNLHYSFVKGDIVSIEPYSSVFSFQEGIEIKHNVKGYAPCVVFTFSGETSKNLIREIKESGFMDGDLSNLNKNLIDEVRKIQKSRLSSMTLNFVYLLGIILFILLYIIIKL